LPSCAGSKLKAAKRRIPVRGVRSLPLLKAGNSMAAKMTTIATATRSSIKAEASGARGVFDLSFDFMSHLRDTQLIAVSLGKPNAPKSSMSFSVFIL
jgi:hypothetical protein